MSRGTLLLVLLLLLPFQGFGQDDVPVVGRRFGGGLLGGLSATQVDGDGCGGYKNLGGVGGIWVQRQLADSWGLRVEIKYVGKGSRSTIKDEAGGRITNYAFTLHYLELPIFAQWLFTDRFSLDLGLGAGYLLAWQERNAYGSLKGIRTDPKRYEITAQAGLEWRFHKHFGVRLGFSYSILPIRGKPDGVVSRIRRGQYNNALTLVLQYEI